MKWRDAIQMQAMTVGQCPQHWITADSLRRPGPSCVSVPAVACFLLVVLPAVSGLLLFPSGCCYLVVDAFCFLLLLPAVFCFLPLHAMCCTLLPAVSGFLVLCASKDMGCVMAKRWPDAGNGRAQISPSLAQRAELSKIKPCLGCLYPMFAAESCLLFAAVACLKLFCAFCCCMFPAVSGVLLLLVLGFAGGLWSTKWQTAGQMRIVFGDPTACSLLFLVSCCFLSFWFCGWVVICEMAHHYQFAGNFSAPMPPTLANRMVFGSPTRLVFLLPAVSCFHLCLPAAVPYHPQFRIQPATWINTQRTLFRTCAMSSPANMDTLCIVFGSPT